MAGGIPSAGAVFNIFRGFDGCGSVDAAVVGSEGSDSHAAWCGAPGGGGRALHGESLTSIITSLMSLAPVIGPLIMRRRYWKSTLAGLCARDAHGLENMVLLGYGVQFEAAASGAEFAAVIPLGRALCQGGGRAPRS